MQPFPTLCCTCTNSFPRLLTAPKGCANLKNRGAIDLGTSIEAADLRRSGRCGRQQARFPRDLRPGGSEKAAVSGCIEVVPLGQLRCSASSRSAAKASAASTADKREAAAVYRSLPAVQSAPALGTTPCERGRILLATCRPSSDRRSALPARRRHATVRRPKLPSPSTNSARLVD